MGRSEAWSIGGGAQGMGHRAGKKGTMGTALPIASNSASNSRSLRKDGTRGQEGGGQGLGLGAQVKNGLMDSMFETQRRQLLWCCMWIGLNCGHCYKLVGLYCMYCHQACLSMGKWTLMLGSHA